jgi:hypothetical protein
MSNYSDEAFHVWHTLRHWGCALSWVLDDDELRAIAPHYRGHVAALREVERRLDELEDWWLDEADWPPPPDSYFMVEPLRWYLLDAIEYVQGMVHRLRKLCEGEVQTGVGGAR